MAHRKNPTIKQDREALLKQWDEEDRITIAETRREMLDGAVQTLSRLKEFTQDEDKDFALKAITTHLQLLGPELRTQEKETKNSAVIVNITQTHAQKVEIAATL